MRGWLVKRVVLGSRISAGTDEETRCHISVDTRQALEESQCSGLGQIKYTVYEIKTQGGTLGLAVLRSKTTESPYRACVDESPGCMGSEGRTTKRACSSERVKKTKKPTAERQEGGGWESEVVPAGNRNGAHSRLSAVIWPSNFGSAPCN